LVHGKIFRSVSGYDRCFCIREGTCMSDIIMIVVFMAMLLAGAGIFKEVDSFIARHVIKCTGTKEEAHEHEQSETDDTV
jgi:hypothetical protein